MATFFPSPLLMLAPSDGNLMRACDTLGSFVCNTIAECSVALF